MLHKGTSNRILDWIGAGETVISKGVRAFADLVIKISFNGAAEMLL